MTNVTVQEALKAAIKELETLKRVFEHDNSDDEIDLCKAALAEIEASEKCEPVANVMPSGEGKFGELTVAGYELPIGTKLYTSPQPMRELQAHINTLLEALQEASRHLDLLQPSSAICKIISEALSATPAESLQAFENEVIEKCENICNKLSDSDSINDDELSGIRMCEEAIGALKEVK